MRSILWVLFCLVGIGWLPAVAQACPLCREAVANSSGAEDTDQMREARAYNNSIYIMVGMPYILVGGFGFAIYRHLKQRAILEAKMMKEIQKPE